MSRSLPHDADPGKVEQAIGPGVGAVFSSTGLFCVGVAMTLGGSPIGEVLAVASGFYGAGAAMIAGVTNTSASSTSTAATTTTTTASTTTSSS